MNFIESLRICNFTYSCQTTAEVNEEHQNVMFEATALPSKEALDQFAKIKPQSVQPFQR